MVESVIENIDVLKSHFSKLIRETAPQYLPLAQRSDDKAKERAIEFFKDAKVREQFFRFYRQIQDLYEIMSPDACLRPFIKDYQRLAELYGLIQNAYNTVYADKELTEKTRKLIRENAEGYDVELPGAIHALGPKELAALRQKGGSATTKILNLRKILEALVKNEGATKPFLLPIGERAQALAQAYEDRQLTTQQALDEFVKLAEQYVDAEHERRKMNVDENTFAIYTTLKPVVKDFRAEQAKAVNGLFENFPDFRWDEQQGSKLRAELYKMVRPIVGAAKMIEVTNTLLRLQRV